MAKINQKTDKKVAQLNKKIEDLESEINSLQRSTRSSLSFFTPFHDKFRLKFRWYQNWHQKRYATLTHILVLFAYSVSSILFSISVVLGPHAIIEAVPTWMDGWGYRKKVTIENNTASSASANALYDVNLNKYNFNFSTDYVQPDGGDIRFQDTSGNQCGLIKNNFNNSTVNYASDNLGREAITRNSGPNAVYYKGRTYYVYQEKAESNGTGKDPQIVYFDHIKGVWSDPYEVGDNTLDNDGTYPNEYPDTHGSPVMNIDDTNNRLYVYWGAHNSPLKRRRFQLPTNAYESPNFFDETKWATLSSLEALTYPQVFPSVGKDGTGKVRIFYMKNTPEGERKIIMASASDYENFTAREIVDFTDATTLQGIYPGRFYYSSANGGEVHMTWEVVNNEAPQLNLSISNCNGGTFSYSQKRRQNLYYAKMKLWAGTSGWMDNAQIDNSQEEVSRAEADAHFIVSNNWGSTSSFWEPKVFLNENNEPIVYYTLEPADGIDTYYEAHYRKYNSSSGTWVLSGGDMPELRSQFNSAATYLESNGDIIVYLAVKASDFTSNRGGNMAKYKSTDGGLNFIYVGRIFDASDNGMAFYDPLVPERLSQQIADDINQTYGSRFPTRLELLHYEWEDCWGSAKLFGYGKRYSDNLYESIGKFPRAKFYVKYPNSIAANSSADIYMYYDNPTVANLTNASGTLYYWFPQVVAAQQAEDVTNPSVSITSPAAGATVSGNVVISATASDNVSVWKVSFYIDGVWKYDDFSSGYSYTWNSTAASSGTHTIKVKAVDSSGNTTEASRSVIVSNTDTTPPTVSMTAPLNNATVSGNIILSATASDVGGISLVEFYRGTVKIGQDNSSPYSYTWNSATVADGWSDLKAKAIDTSNNSAFSSTVRVNVDNVITDTTPPSISIIQPINGSKVSGMIDVSADASDNVGVNRVEFRIDNTLVDTETSPGFDGYYGFAWNSYEVDPGAHTIQARALDAAGNYNNHNINVNVVLEVPDADALAKKMNPETNSKDWSRWWDEEIPNSVTYRGWFMDEIIPINPKIRSMFFDAAIPNQWTQGYYFRLFWDKAVPFRYTNGYYSKKFWDSAVPNRWADGFYFRMFWDKFVPKGWTYRYYQNSFWGKAIPSNWTSGYYYNTTKYKAIPNGWAGGYYKYMP